MIIWISGPYGVGKSTLAEAMAAKMNNALIFDAEEVGNAVRENYPDCPYGYIFEDYPLWGEFCYLLLKDVHEKFHKDILVPMTLLRAESYSIIEKLIRDGIDTRLVVLEASYQTVHDRILARGEEEGCWCMENIELARAGSAALPGIHVQADGKTVIELCDEVLNQMDIKWKTKLRGFFAIPSYQPCNRIVRKGRPCRTVFRNLKYALKVSVKVQFNFVDMSMKSKHLYRRNGG